ncbi:hypothetical protein JRQ81_003476 [Phrynocephalus forsythii]|uniref:Ig-like domain-containing protein n=1 Tax=Phrynocephalus forsythii TaxID=171643 RepID=A0A9Q0XJU4_9SAUR|nr:hypothetical protein JRQ81_003476 [Phrynocephalus forsythii]
MEVPLLDLLMKLFLLKNGHALMTKMVGASGDQATLPCEASSSHTRWFWYPLNPVCADISGNSVEITQNQTTLEVTPLRFNRRLLFSNQRSLLLRNLVTSDAGLYLCRLPNGSETHTQLQVNPACHNNLLVTSEWLPPSLLRLSCHRCFPSRRTDSFRWTVNAKPLGNRRGNLFGVIRFVRFCHRKDHRSYTQWAWSEGVSRMDLGHTVGGSGLATSCSRNGRVAVEMEKTGNQEMPGKKRTVSCSEMSSSEYPTGKRIEALNHFDKVEQQESLLALKDVMISNLVSRMHALEHTTYDGCFLWKIPEVGLRIQEAQTFYTSRYGYKVCLKLFLNGDGTGFGTHLSLFLVLMKGEYDFQLKWPFQHKRPVSEANIASGLPEFCPLDLFHCSQNNYICNDVLAIQAVISAKA